MRVEISSLQAGLAALSAGFSSAREAIALFRDARALKGVEGTDTPPEQLAFAEQQLAIAEAQIAQALGYSLCTCAFPPAIMLRVGYIQVVSKGERRPSRPVHECPKCKANDATPWSFTRTSSAA